MSLLKLENLLSFPYTYLEFSIPVFTGVLRLADLIIIVTAALLTYYIRFDNLQVSEQYILLVLAILPIAANIFHVFKLYDFSLLTSYSHQLRNLFLAWVWIILLWLAIGFLTETSTDLSRLWVILWFLLALVLLSILRLHIKLMVSCLKKQGKLTRNIAIVGAGEQGQHLVKYLCDNKNLNLNVLGIFDDRKTRIKREIGGYKVLGTTDDLLQYARKQDIDEIIVALPWSSESRLSQILKLRTIPVDIRLCPEKLAFQFRGHKVSYLDGVAMLNIFERPLSHWKHLLKWIEDRLFAILILICICPIMLLVAIIIKIDSAGPVFFKQKRYGFNNKLIWVYKFRTMYHEVSPDRDTIQATRNDPRVTRVGAFMRRTSLDELPQFLNVLKGEMSIVGPRPHTIAHNEHFSILIDGYLARHNVKPGITGWAQIKGFRGEIRRIEDLENRVKHDLYYIDHWSLLFDIRIMIMTIIFGFVHKNAY